MPCHHIVLRRTDWSHSPKKDSLVHHTHLFIFQNKEFTYTLGQKIIETLNEFTEKKNCQKNSLPSSPPVVEESGLLSRSSFLSVLGFQGYQQRIMVRIIWAVDFQLWSTPSGTLIPPVGMVNMAASDVSCCGDHLLKAQLQKLL